MSGTPIREAIPAVDAVEDDPETEDVDESMAGVAEVEANETRGAVVPLGTPENYASQWMLPGCMLKIPRWQERRTTYYGS